MGYDLNRLQNAYRIAKERLLSERNSCGFWEGELSSSALSTATAIAALAIVSKSNLQTPIGSIDSQLIDRGLSWLTKHQNPDGGWGDTIRSFSNISTTMLCRAAFHIADRTNEYRDCLMHCEKWLAERYGKTPEQLAQAVRDRYGKDHTFSVPILTMCALGNLVEWAEVPRLPFELACLPQSWYRFAGLPVVSYALPALIAIGQCIHHHRGTWNPLTKTLRWLGRGRSLHVLSRMQPSSGGYLEATPLTSFVVMSLASFSQHPSAVEVIRKGVQFLLDSVRPDGSWPIDTNLATWVTTLSINSLAIGSDLSELTQKEQLREWIASQQGKERHPFTGAAPGAWGWSHLPGSVPDADDTPGALIALHRLTAFPEEDPIRICGERWLLDLQNRDGGWPTFCRGWGLLPFDRSGTDLTAHAIRALSLSPESRIRHQKAIESGFEYLRKTQRSDGSWLPLWFGNQHALNDDENPVYGTSRVLAAYRDLDLREWTECQRGAEYLLKVQNQDGSWGDPDHRSSSVEETALAIEVLLDLVPTNQREKVMKGIEWLIQKVEVGSFVEPSPIGFYFAKLWYFEKLYPIIFTVGALGRAMRVLKLDS